MANFCKHCGAQLAEGAAFCPSCGAKQEAPDPKAFCVSCGAELAEDAKFCKKCGTPVAPAPSRPQKAYCAVCGAELTEGARFCKVCGASADSAAPTKPVNPAAQAGYAHQNVQTTYASDRARQAQPVYRDSNQAWFRRTGTHSTRRCLKPFGSLASGSVRSCSIHRNRRLARRASQGTRMHS